MTPHVSFTSVVRKHFLRRATFPDRTIRLGIVATFVTAAFYFAFSSAFVSRSNLAFGQSYSTEKNAWKSTRPQIEPGATSASDVASKRANVLLNSSNNRVSASKSKVKKSSRSSASSLKTYRPNVAASSFISPSSFSEKKVDLYDSSDRFRNSPSENSTEEDVITDKEKLFDELARRNRINLDKEREKTPGEASFELTEPQVDETETAEDSPAGVAPCSSDSTSVSLDEEVEDVQSTRKNCFFSELELDGSSDEEIDDEISSAIPPSEDVVQEIETLKKQIDETLEQIEEDSAPQEENETVTENVEEVTTEDVLSTEPEFEAPIIDIDELQFESREEVETADAEREENETSSEAENQLETESEIDETDETVVRESFSAVEKVALVEESNESPEEENQVELNSEATDDSKTDVLESVTQVERPIEAAVAFPRPLNVDLKESDAEEDESDVPQTGSVQTQLDKPVRYPLPRHSILSLDDDESENEIESTSESVEKDETVEESSTTSNDSTPNTFAENEEIKDKLNDEEVPAEITTPADEKQDVKKTTIQEESINDETSPESPKAARVGVNSSAVTTQEISSKGEEGFFLKWRVLQRTRQRRLFNGRLLEAPTPPSIDDLDPEVANQRTEPPLLTKENANLPSLDVEGKTYAANKPALESVETEKIREEMKKFSWTKGAFTITPYGFLNLSVAADTQRSTPGEFILYVQSPEVDDSPGFSVDARTSRLGLDIAGPRVEALSADLGGKVEFDFQGSVNGSKNKGGLQLRRAYVELVDKQHDRRFLAGQDWEIISPVAPQMLNYLPLGFVGDMQYRRGQVRVEQGWTCSSDLHVLGQIAVCDNVIGDYVSTSGVSAATSGWPILEARLAGAFFGEARDGLPITLGISGHIGEQNYKFSALAGVPSASTAVKRPIKTWSANFDLDAPITKTQKLQGEVFTGSNLSTFCGGINQGIDLIRREGIRSSGGWLAWHSDCTEKMDVNFGYGIDKPNEKDLVGTSSPSNGYTTARTQNQVYFVNCIYNWTPNFMTGLETSYWQTDYQRAYVASDKPVFYDMEAGKSTRFEFVTRLSF